MVESSRAKGQEKCGEVWREVWKNEGEIMRREEEWKAMVEKELQDQDNQSMELEKEKKEAKKELDTIKQLLDTIKQLLSRKRTRPRDPKLEGKSKKAEMKKMEEEMKKREKEWKAKMKKKEEELQNKDNQILKLHLELAREKKDKDEAKKELTAFNQLKLEDLQRRKRRKPTDEIKGEYIEEEDVKVKIEAIKEEEEANIIFQVKGEYMELEDVKVKTESKEIAEKDDDNNGSPRYSQRFFRMEAGLY